MWCCDSNVHRRNSASYFNNSHGIEGFQGGETRFFDETVPAIVVINCVTLTEDTPICSVKPETGKAIIFTQAMRHDGAALKGETGVLFFLNYVQLTYLQYSGAKYILRTEIMYRRIKSALDRSPALLAACEDLKRIAEAYKKSTEGADSGTCCLFASEQLCILDIKR